MGDDVTTNNLENIMYAWGGAFENTDKSKEGISELTLLQTTEDAMLMNEKDIRFSAEDPKALLGKHVPGGKQLPLAIKVSGSFESNFPAAPNGSSEDVIAKGHLSKSVKPGTIIAFSDVDFMADDYSAVSQNLFGTDIVNFLNDNQTLAINSLDNLTGNADLIALRSRGRFTRPFSKVQRIEADAQDKYKDVEKEFQAVVDQANERLSKIQSGVKSEGKSAFMNQALLTEIQKIRDERRDAQRDLRKVRLALRQDKEFLGSVLFVANTFLVPVFLIVLYFLRAKSKKRTA